MLEAGIYILLKYCCSLYLVENGCNCGVGGRVAGENEGIPPAQSNGTGQNGSGKRNL